MGTMTKKQRRSACYYALVNPGNAPLLKIFTIVIVVMLLLQYNAVFSFWLTGSFIAVALVANTVLFKTAFDEWADANEHTKHALLVHWARGARSAEERASREEYMLTHSMDDSMDFAAIEYNGPAANVDGTAMLPGGICDVNGNAYGIISDFNPTFNDATSDYAFPDEAYTSPTEM
ncbi:MAG: hypothetical protein Q7S87_16420 [Agitococcus sp.]|nr:hypothetical protein [Agitococcus sp.]MDO9176964.1 hypothetical protein [Agitococcus sp.]